MLVISFFTTDWKYQQHALRLRSECDKLGIRHRIEQLPSTGSWLRNCCLKPAYILKCLIDEEGPVLWVDVDSHILKHPVYFEGGLECDLQARRMTGRNRTWHVTVMWWNYSPDAIAYIRRWIANTGESTDESAMEFTWRQEASIIARDIPDDYFGFTDTEPFGVICSRTSRSESKKREIKEAQRYEQEVI